MAYTIAPQCSILSILLKVNSLRANLLRLAICVFVLGGCYSGNNNSEVVGVWRVTFDLGGVELPFHAEIMEEEGKLQT